MLQRSSFEGSICPFALERVAASPPDAASDLVRRSGGGGDLRSSRLEFPLWGAIYYYTLSRSTAAERGTVWRSAPARATRKDAGEGDFAKNRGIIAENCLARRRRLEKDRISYRLWCRQKGCDRMGDYCWLQFFSWVFANVLKNCIYAKTPSNLTIIDLIVFFTGTGRRGIFCLLLFYVWFSSFLFQQTWTRIRIIKCKNIEYGAGFF